MIKSKYEFVKSFLPETVTDFDFTQINLDTTDLSLSDILRNLNKLYPSNSRTRMKIESGEMMIGVLCKTETLDPYNGVFMLIGKKDMNLDIISCNYIVLCISEEKIKTETSIEDAIEGLTSYLIENFSKSMKNLPDFYRKFVYNESELYDDDYKTEEY